MSLIWSIIFGLILSSVLKSGWGFIIGLFIGPMLYQALGNKLTEKRTQSNPTLYLTIAFEVLGHLSKAKGVVTQDDINLARQFMDRLQLDATSRQLAQQSFNRGKASDYPLRSRLRELYFQYRFRRNVLNIFCEQLIQAALVDGKLDEKESQILFIVADEFHIPRQRMVIYIQMMMGSFHFRHGYYDNQQNSQYQQNNQYNQSNHYGGYQSNSRQTDLQNAYKILGIDSSADKEMLEAAKKRAQEIQAAYDLIKASRGFK